ncbi:MAG: DUF4339 domain-containing protein [Bauldia sp.]
MPAPIRPVRFTAALLLAAVAAPALAQTPKPAPPAQPQPGPADPAALTPPPEGGPPPVPQMAVPMYFYVANGQPQGPLTIAELRMRVEDGTVGRQTLVSTAGDGARGGPEHAVQRDGELSGDAVSPS